MTRTGRPRKDDEQAKRGQIHIRLTYEQLEQIDRVAKAYNLSRTDAILLGIEKLEKEIGK